MILLTPQDVQRRLHIGRTKFYRELPRLKRMGLHFFPIFAGGKQDLRVTEDDLSKIVDIWKRKAAEREQKKEKYLKEHRGK